MTDMQMIRAAISAGMTISAVLALMRQGYTARQIARGAMVPMFETKL